MTSLRVPEALLLDAGNTVVFLDHDAVAEAAQGADIQVTGDALRRAEPTAKRRYEQEMARGMSHEDGWTLHMRVLFETAGLPIDMAERASLAAREAHDRFNLWRRVPVDLEPALERARRAGIRLAVVSNSEGKLDSLFDTLRIAHWFEHVLDSAIEGVRKPDPEIFRRALARLGVPADRSLYAGDIPKVDVQGARAAGMDAVLIDPFDHYPDYAEAPRFASVAELVRALGL